MAKPVYIAAYHQSKFGKLLGSTVPDIIEQAVGGACREIGAEPAAIDVASIGAACNIALNSQGLLSGPRGDGARARGQADRVASRTPAPPAARRSLSVIHKLLARRRRRGHRGRLREDARRRRQDGRQADRRGARLLLAPGRARRQGVRLPAHLRRGHGRLHEAVGRQSRRDLAQIAVVEYANAKHNPCAQMQKVQITLEQAMTIEGINRYVVDGLPLKTYDCSQITDGYAALILATEEGPRDGSGSPKADAVETRGVRAGDRPAEEGRARRAAPGRRATAR